MPNGEDKNWIRLCAAMEGFFLRYGHWPTRIRAPRYAFDDFRHLFRPESLHALLERFEIELDEEHFAAESEGGRRYDYMYEGFPAAMPPVGAQTWLGVHPDAHDGAQPHGREEDSAEIRYDLFLGGRCLRWLQPAEMIREVVRFFANDLRFGPTEIRELAGKPLWREISRGALTDERGPRALTPRDADSAVPVENLVRFPDGTLVSVDDDLARFGYRDILYRLDAVLPFGLLSWKRSELLSRTEMIRRLQLEPAMNGGRGVRSPYVSPAPDRGRPIPNSYWVSADEDFLAGEYPFEKDFDAGHAKLARLLTAGVRCFVDLTTGDEGLERYRDFISEDGASLAVRPEYHSHPLPPGSIESIDKVSLILDTIADALARGLKVYVHDRSGMGRAATVVGCHLVRRGLTGEQALHQLVRLVSVMPKASSRKPLEGDEQRTMVRMWAERDPRRRR